MFSVSRSFICIVHSVSVAEKAKFVATKAYDLVTFEDPSASSLSRIPVLPIRGTYSS